ncbi:DUF3291 domain-containing protein [Fibrella sp. HMF5335]|uniref:DUF3291 domain-containing protein n=1 Tax=Fibrella rubiginis TaxID=2817060 RepID=A0A939GEE6_9BACT|nr:DUF3291 domain-containing protein [Fibrella rubiginis]MBO0936253.1 DUF3291 domain-containing protein [Fibrella rubiginis]
MHIAQINISRLLAPIHDPLIADFAAQLDEINALAERSPGFVWRLKGEGNNATDLSPFADDLIIVTMSVWTSVEALKQFAFKSAHTVVMRRRDEWFSTFPTAYLALWWVDEGHEPTVDEAKARLRSLDEHGPTPFAFTFRQLFSPHA